MTRWQVSALAEVPGASQLTPRQMKAVVALAPLVENQVRAVMMENGLRFRRMGLRRQMEAVCLEMFVRGLAWPLVDADQESEATGERQIEL